MRSALLTSPKGFEHRLPADHVERVERLETVMAALGTTEFSALPSEEARLATREEVERVHAGEYVGAVFEAHPDAGEMIPIDWDSWLSDGSLGAALQAAGAAAEGVDRVMAGEHEAVFAPTRPPGHHAEPGKGMGFCIFNSVGVAAKHALDAHGLERVAVIDIDVHHGNGTQCLAETDERIFFASIHQSPLYPGTGGANETGLNGNVVNTPMPAGTAGAAWRERIRTGILPALEAFSPQLVLVSAGFDGHAEDPLGGFGLLEEDFAWAAGALAAQAKKSADNRLVSLLEGGYDCGALGRSTQAFLRALIEA
jgi:acetoin utilization deacetylase AcuC-like enzyme